MGDRKTARACTFCIKLIMRINDGRRLSVCVCVWGGTLDGAQWIASHHHSFSVPTHKTTSVTQHRSSYPIRTEKLARKFVGELMLVVLRTATGSIPWPVIYKLNKGYSQRKRGTDNPLTITVRTSPPTSPSTKIHFTKPQQFNQSPERRAVIFFLDHWPLLNSSGVQGGCCVMLYVKWFYGPKGTATGKNWIRHRRTQ